MFAYRTSAYPITLQLSEGEINLYPQVEVYNSSVVLTATYDLVHVASGLYKYIWAVPDFPVKYTLVFKVYTDVGHTVLSTVYGIGSDDIMLVENIDTNFSGLSLLAVGIDAKTTNLPASPANEITLAAVKAKTDLLPAAPANEVTVAAIKAKTDLLPGDPTSEALATANKVAIIAAINAESIENFNIGAG